MQILTQYFERAVVPVNKISTGLNTDFEYPHPKVVLDSFKTYPSHLPVNSKGENIFLLAFLT